MIQPRDDITELIQDWRAGDAEAEQAVLAHVYRELHGLADRYLRHESAGHTLQPTALVNEAYLRLVGEKDPGVTNRAHLIGIAARLMRQILVNHAVRKRTAKRGGEWSRIALESTIETLEQRCIDLVALHEALNRLAEIDARQAQIVELRFFGGMSVEETAEALDTPKRTVEREWTMARAWLRREIAE